MQVDPSQFDASFPELRQNPPFTGSDGLAWIIENVDSEFAALENRHAIHVCNTLLTMQSIIPVAAIPSGEDEAGGYSTGDNAWYSFNIDWSGLLDAGFRFKHAVDPTEPVKEAPPGPHEWANVEPIGYNQDETPDQLHAETSAHPLLMGIITNASKSELRALVGRWGPLVQDSRGRTALHYAVIMNSGRACKLLLKHGAEVNAMDMNGATPLMYAAFKAHLDALITLFKHGATNEPDKYGQTALHWAVRHYSTDILKAILAQKEFVQAINQQDMNAFGTPLHTSISSYAVDHTQLLLGGCNDVAMVENFIFGTLLASFHKLRYHSAELRGLHRAARCFVLIGALIPVALCQNWGLRCWGRPLRDGPVRQDLP